jgi:hypothetical protein
MTTDPRLAELLAELTSKLALLGPLDELHCNCNPLAARKPKWTVANPLLSEM